MPREGSTDTGASGALTVGSGNFGAMGDEIGAVLLDDGRELVAFRYSAAVTGTASFGRGSLGNDGTGGMRGSATCRLGSWRANFIRIRSGSLRNGLRTR
jgi:hypothetical protein